MKRVMTTGWVVLMLAATALADSKDRTFEGKTYDEVWTACVRAATENFSVSHTDKESGILEFHTGISMTSNGFRCSVAVIKQDNGKIKVKLNTQKKMQLFAWGAGGRIGDKYFKAVDKILKGEESTEKKN